MNEIEEVSPSEKICPLCKKILKNSKEEYEFNEHEQKVWFTICEFCSQKIDL